MGADTVKGIAEVGEGIDVVWLAGGDQAIDDSGTFRTGIASRKLPVLAGDDGGPEDDP